jgi:hypothetical protein
MGLYQEFGGGVSTSSVGARGQRGRGSEVGSPIVKAPLDLQMNETHIVIRLLRLYIPRNWEFRSALAKYRNLGVGGFEPPKLTTGKPLNDII